LDAQNDDMLVFTLLDTWLPRTISIVVLRHSFALSSLTVLEKF
jgi:hypothetical protein